MVSSCHERERITELTVQAAGLELSLGGSMVGGAVPTAAAPPAVARTSATGRLETRGSTASRLAERRAGLTPEVAPAQLAPRRQVRGQVPGRTSRPQAVPPRPGVRELVREAYGPDVDVPAWFAELDVDDLVALTAGEVADFVAWCLD